MMSSSLFMVDLCGAGVCWQMDCSAWPDGYQLLVAHNDFPRNGLTLCRLCHWPFDEGLLGVSAACRLLAAAQLSLEPNLPGHLAPLQGRAIFLPEEEPRHPDKMALAWHRSKCME